VWRLRSELHRRESEYRIRAAFIQVRNGVDYPTSRVGTERFAPPGLVSSTE